MAGFSPVAAHARPTIVSLTFDDGTRDQLIAANLLNQYGMKGTFYINSGVIGDSTHFTLADLQKLQSQGHEIGGHTIDHPDLTTIAPADEQREICQDHDTLKGWGFPAVSFAYPFGHSTPAIETIVKNCGYISGREITGLSCNFQGCLPSGPIPPADAYNIPAAPPIVTSNVLFWLETYVTNSENKGGGWVPIVFHHICDNCGQYSTSQADLAAFLAWLQPRAAQGTVVQTVAQVMGAEPVNPPPVIPLVPVVPANPLTPTQPDSGGPAGGSDAPADLSGVRVFPNPWRADRHSPLLIFSGLPDRSQVKLFTVSGRWVQTLDVRGSIASWDLANNAGQSAASGLYLYQISDPFGHTHRGLLTLIR